MLCFCSFLLESPLCVGSQIMGFVRVPVTLSKALVSNRPPSISLCIHTEECIRRKELDLASRRFERWVNNVFIQYFKCDSNKYNTNVSSIGMAQKRVEWGLTASSLRDGRILPNGWVRENSRHRWYGIDRKVAMWNDGIILREAEEIRQTHWKLWRKESIWWLFSWYLELWAGILRGCSLSEVPIWQAAKWLVSLSLIPFTFCAVLLPLASLSYTSWRNRDLGGAGSHLPLSFSPRNRSGLPSYYFWGSGSRGSLEIILLKPSSSHNFSSL